MKLQTKLIVAFSIVVLSMGIIQSIFLHTRIQTTFENYLAQNSLGYMERMKKTLELYYHDTGSWENVEQLFSDTHPSNGQGRGRMTRGISTDMAFSKFDILLLDTEGTILADSTGNRIGKSGINLSGITKELLIDGDLKGTLVLENYRLLDLEKEFLRASQTTVIISSLIATGMAVLISLWIAGKLSYPLKKLMTGINHIANGEEVTLINITSKDEFRELGEAFNEMSLKLERNEEMRQSLVADVAHELRTPLTILQGKLESIQEGAIRPTEDVVMELTDEVYRLNRLVKDLQQLSLAEAGQLVLETQMVDMKEFLVKVCSNLQWLADEKGIALKQNKIPNGSFLQIDVDRMTQVIVNLVGNALRHTPENGLVEVSGYDSGIAFIVQVSDTGPGIPEDIIPFIFDRFYKRDPARARNKSGTGLGLSIAKGFVEAHEGSITVESEVNKGTIFTVILPKN